MAIFSQPGKACGQINSCKPVWIVRFTGGSTGGLKRLDPVGEAA